MMAAVGINVIKVTAEIAIVGGHVDDLIAANQFFRMPAVLDQLGDCAGLELVFLLKFTQFPYAGHRAIVVHDLANHPRSG